MKYRFKFQIVEEGSERHPIESDWAYLGSIDEYGGCEMVDMCVASMLRFWNSKGRAEYERKVYGDDDYDRDDG